MADPVYVPPPVAFVRDRVCALLRTKPEFFDKLFAVEETEALIKSFVFEESTMRIFFGASAKEMTVWTQPPPTYKKKVRARGCCRTSKPLCTPTLTF